MPSLAHRSQNPGVMLLRDSSIPIPSLAGRPRDKIRAVGTGVTAMQDLTQIVRTLAEATALRPAVERLQQDMTRILRVRDALCFWIDWPHRIAWTLGGRMHHGVEEQVIESAGSGKRTMLAGAVLAPIGPRPARAVLALRKASGMTFTPSELTVIHTLAQTIAAPLDRLIRPTCS